MNQMASGSKTELERAIATIRKFKGDKSNWLQVANAVAFIRDNGHWRGSYRSESEWLDAAANEYGVTRNTLGRILAAAKFLSTQLKNSSGSFPVIDLFCGTGSFHMGTVELIKRMHDISPARAKKALSDHLKDQLTYREAKKQYDSLFSSDFGKTSLVITNPPYAESTVDPAKFSRRLAHKERSDLSKLIESHIEILSGVDASEAEIGKIKFEYVTPDAVVVGRKNSQAHFVDGFEFKRLALSSSKAALIKVVSEAAFSASFFRRYWLIIDATQKEAQKVIESVDDLELENVGVARYTPDRQDNLAFLKKPRGAPIPNRHSRSLEKVSFSR